MRAIIPAAGVGERLRPMTLYKPKVLLPVAGKPIIGHIYERLIQLGIDEVTVIVGHFGAMVKEYSRQNFPLRFKFVEQSERRGLGHAIGLGLDEKPEPVLIILGDTILEMDYRQLLDQSANVIGVMPVDDPRRFGVVVQANGRVVQLVEKPDQPISNQGIAGIYLIQDGSKLKSAIDYIVAHDIRTKNEYQLTDALQVMLTRGEKFVTAEVTRCHDCGTKETLLKANRQLMAADRVPQTVYPNSRIIPPVAIAGEVNIENSTVGPYVSLSPGVSVTDSVIRDSIVDAKAVIRSSILEGALVAEGNIVEHVTGPEPQMDV